MTKLRLVYWCGGDIKQSLQGRHFQAKAWEREIQVAHWMCDVMENMDDDNVIAAVREKVAALCKQFPVYG